MGLYQRWMALPKGHRIFVCGFTMVLAICGDYVSEKIWEEQQARKVVRKRLEEQAQRERDAVKKVQKNENAEKS